LRDKYRLAVAAFQDQFLSAAMTTQEGPMWFREQAATWQGTWPGSWQTNWQHFAERTRQLAADESGLRQRIWNKLKRETANIPFVEDALTAHYCAFDRNTPLYVKLALVGAVVYFLVPDDLIPDSIPVLGVADDAAVLAGAMKIFAAHIKPEHRQAAKLMLERMRRA
jgi:uncharacterized membrane protein YkvA (DUF1232 family)